MRRSSAWRFAPENAPSIVSARVAVGVQRVAFTPAMEVVAFSVTGLYLLVSLAEAVYAIGLPDGRGVVVKIADGGQRARPVVAAAALRELGVEAEVLERLTSAPILGHGQPVGAVRAV